ncbi:MAG TPA: hypothetical protein VGI45_05955 [Terracidiphilus sp.]
MSSHENTSRTAQQGSSADGKHEPFRSEMFANEPKHFLVVHERLLPITTGYK